MYLHMALYLLYTVLYSFSYHMDKYDSQSKGMGHMDQSDRFSHKSDGHKTAFSYRAGRTARLEKSTGDSVSFVHMHMAVHLSLDKLHMSQGGKQRSSDGSHKTEMLHIDSHRTKTFDCISVAGDFLSHSDKYSGLSSDRVDMDLDDIREDMYVHM